MCPSAGQLDPRQIVISPMQPLGSVQSRMRSGRSARPSEVSDLTFPK
jgi:hypothetical protein